FEATDVLALLRAGKIAREYRLKAVYVGAGDEYRLRDQVAAMKPDLILKVDFPRPYRLDDESEWIDVPLERLRRIDRAPSNPKWLRDAGLTFSFTTAGLENAEDFTARVREAVARGLSREDALAAVTTTPARQLGFADRLGTIEAGMIADLAVETGEPFTQGSRVTEIWIDGKRIELPERRRPEGARGGDSLSTAGRGEGRGEGGGGGAERRAPRFPGRSPSLPRAGSRRSRITLGGHRPRRRDLDRGPAGNPRKRRHGRRQRKSRRGREGPLRSRRRRRDRRGR